MSFRLHRPVLFAFAALLAAAPEAFAVFELEVSPRRGGRDIRFEASEPGGLLRNEEVTVAVSTDEGFQYRVQQTMFQPLTNERGDVIPQDRFVLFSPSSPSGTLRPQLETPVRLGPMDLYTSTRDGAADEFVLVYNVRVPEDQPGGVYRTQIQFAAEPVGPAAGATQRVVNLEVRVEIRATFRIAMRTSAGGQALSLGRVTAERPVAKEVLELRIESNIGSPFRIFQRLAEPPLSDGGASPDEERFTVTPLGSERGSLASPGAAQPVPSAPTLLYTSDASGSGDVIRLEYAVTGADELPAGAYRGALQFEVRSSAATVSAGALSVPLRFEVEPLFFLDVRAEDGAGGFHFGTYKTGQERQVRQVRIRARSNLGEPYQISQILSRPLANEAGDTLPEGSLVYVGSGPERGTVKATAEMSVPQGESVVYTSGPKGEPEEIVLRYVLSIPPEAKAGSYNTDLKYSITTL